jgi:hypothetical protein
MSPLDTYLFTFKVMQLIWLGLAVLESLIALRIVLKLFAANPASLVAALIYGFTNLLLFPFAGLMPTPASGGMVLEISSVVAMVVYVLLGWALAKLVEVVFYRPVAQLLP